MEGPCGFGSLFHQRGRTLALKYALAGRPGFDESLRSCVLYTVPGAQGGDAVNREGVDEMFVMGVSVRLVRCLVVLAAVGEDSACSGFRLRLRRPDGLADCAGGGPPGMRGPHRGPGPVMRDYEGRSGLSERCKYG